VISLTVALEAGETSSHQQTSKISRYLGNPVEDERDSGLKLNTIP
jgi:hypothetical protein